MALYLFLSKFALSVAGYDVKHRNGISASRQLQSAHRVPTLNTHCLGRNLFYFHFTFRVAPLKASLHILMNDNIT